ncbi:LacI family DNA-binding transcriptional regulator [Ruicaihuangia caeni]|uniref:LacI family DNA-binding transcriptional regulator n=1 Tax=Ruicaihuangia caeni TaxID=3042517 RepID=UPI00338E647F
MVTIREVAEAAGVSQATAARALNGYGSVSARALERVTESAARLGYKTNMIAQALRLGQTRAIGFVPGDIENPFFAKIARHLGDTLEASGYTLLLSSSDERPDRERKVVETLRQHMVSGFVVAPTAQDDAPHLAQLVEDGVPLVLIDRRVEGLRADSVTVNNEGAGFQAVLHLIEHGHRDIAILVDDLQIASSAERFAGYQKALDAHGIRLEPTYIGVGGASREGAYEAAHRVLTLAHRPTALFATDNFMTEGALRALRDLGLRMPADVSIVGFDDFDLTTFVDPAVTVVAQPIAELGQEAGRLILRRLEGAEDEPHNVNLLAELIIRGSVEAPPASDAA